MSAFLASKLVEGPKTFRVLFLRSCATQWSFFAYLEMSRRVMKRAKVWTYSTFLKAQNYKKRLTERVNKLKEWERDLLFFLV